MFWSKGDNIYICKQGYRYSAIYRADLILYLSNTSVSNILFFKKVCFRAFLTVIQKCFSFFFLSEKLFFLLLLRQHMTKKLHNLILIVLFTYKSPNVRDIHVISVFSCLPVYLICNVFFLFIRSLAENSWLPLLRKCLWLVAPVWEIANC